MSNNAHRHIRQAPWRIEEIIVGPRRRRAMGDLAALTHRGARAPSPHRHPSGPRAPRWRSSASRRPGARLDRDDSHRGRSRFRGARRICRKRTSKKLHAQRTGGDQRGGRTDRARRRGWLPTSQQLHRAPHRNLDIRGDPAAGGVSLARKGAAELAFAREKGFAMNNVKFQAIDPKQSEEPSRRHPIHLIFQACVSMRHFSKRQA